MAAFQTPELRKVIPLSAYETDLSYSPNSRFTIQSIYKTGINETVTRLHHRLRERDRIWTRDEN